LGSSLGRLSFDRDEVMEAWPPPIEDGMNVNASREWEALPHSAAH